MVKKHSRLRTLMPDVAKRRKDIYKEREEERERQRRNKEKGIAVAGGDREKRRNKEKERDGDGDLRQGRKREQGVRGP